MKKLLIVVMVLFGTLAYAQFNQDAPWMQQLNLESRTASNPVKFQDIVNAFNTYWETRDPNVKGSGYKPFKRWEAYWSNFVGQDGTLPTASELWNTYLEVVNKKNNARSSNSIVDQSNWVPVGPFTHTNTGSWSSGQGRVNVVVQDPNNASTIYAGAPAGGIWKSTDSGNTWNTTTDNLPQIGVSGIVVDNNNSNIIYIATGDDDAGDSYSVGVMKSTDGGLTWNTTGLNPNNSPSSMNDIYMHPTNSNTLWVATNNGVYKTTNAGVSWTNQNTSGGSNGTTGLNIRDLKIKPNDPNTLYAVSSNRFYRSTNGGESFALAGTGLPSAGTISRYVIDVTPANPNVVYVLASNNSYGFAGVFKSTNSGLTFTQVASLASNGDVFESTQSWYDLAFAVSDTNENEIYTGVLNIWKGNVSGTQSTFTKLNSWSAPFSSSYSHADIHFLRFFNGELYAGTDGGFYKSSNGGTSFTDLTAGMQISQFYRISVSKQTSDKMVGGLQDNGGHAYSNGQWQNYYGADGMDTAIDPSNSDMHYGFTQNGGGLYYSSTAGASLSGSVSQPAGENGNWITPLFMNSNSELYSGYSSLYKLQNNNWVAVSSSFGTNIDVLEIDELNVNNIYVATNTTLRKSTNAGVSFSTVETFTSNITSIEVNNTDNNIVYVTTSGSSGQVYKSTDGGNNFTNISSGLPSVTKNSIKHQALHSKNPLYLGTSLGVYRYDDDTLTWELFNNGLPNVSVRDIEINTFDDKITAATYGRGIWQSEIPTELAPSDVKLVAVNGISSAIECNSNISALVDIKNNGVSTITSVDFTYLIDGASNSFTWTGNLASEATTTVALPQFSLSKGQHTFEVNSTIANDAYSFNNNSELKTIYANDSGTADVVNTFEAAQDKLLVYDEGATTQYWKIGIPTGTVLNNPSNNLSNKVYGTNLSGDHANNTKSYLISQCYDLSSLANPEVKFDMAFELEQDWDIVYMEYSTDQGVTWSVLGSATDANWYNSDTTQGENNTCFNCPGAQWTGKDPQYATLTEYSYDLSPFNTETSIMFRFVFHSDQSVVEEGAIIDNFVVASNPVLSVEDFNTNSFLVYPNPSNGVFNIKTNANQTFNLSVYDVTGKIIYTQLDVKATNTNYQLDLSTYSTGVYFLNLESNNSKITKKLIVK
ncbi:T9SS type A sorting domain-containing protein [Olleya aquimaris]|uniref:Putative secreted protein (Por secretion system target) n=1 Tax=Olleya aquimaris TaxID=639310 RepID=A0A327RLV1_9FLAO|nr:T9SS type A sorting domain-containing protein [Olleya aquimaris]RAJ18010.1 putative secreted protein (Por secretion system target) [Olleya aquimaris]